MKPRILVFDIETKPVRAWIWRVGSKIYLSHEQICAGEKFDIICICYKWLGESSVYSLDWGINKQDSTQMIESFTKVVESADLAIGHNIDAFDLKQINTQRLLHNQAPIAWPTTEDTLKQFRKHFAFPSYRLDYLAKVLTGSGKDRMSFADWLDIVVDRKPKALAKMVRYCKRDVMKTAQIFHKAAKHFMPKAHAGLITGAGTESCPRCGSIDTRCDGYKLLRAGRYQRFQCLNCASKYRSNIKEAA